MAGWARLIGVNVKNNYLGYLNLTQVIHYQKNVIGTSSIFSIFFDKKRAKVSGPSKGE